MICLCSFTVKYVLIFFQLHCCNGLKPDHVFQELYCKTRIKAQPIRSVCINKTVKKMLMTVELLEVYQVLWTNGMQITSTYVNNDFIVLFLNKVIDYQIYSLILCIFFFNIELRSSNRCSLLIEEKHVNKRLTGEQLINIRISFSFILDCILTSFPSLYSYVCMYLFIQVRNLFYSFIVLDLICKANSFAL